MMVSLGFAALKPKMRLTPLYTSARASMASNQEKPVPKVWPMGLSFLYRYQLSGYGPERRAGHTIFRGQYQPPEDRYWIGGYVRHQEVREAMSSPYICIFGKPVDIPSARPLNVPNYKFEAFEIKCGDGVESDVQEN